MFTFESVHTVCGQVTQDDDDEESELTAFVVARSKGANWSSEEAEEDDQRDEWAADWDDEEVRPVVFEMFAGTLSHNPM